MSTLFPAPQSLTFGAVMDGRHEVPPVRTQGTGRVQVEFAPDLQSILVRLAVQNMSQVTMAHIHLGPPGQNGPVALWLFRSDTGIDARPFTPLTNQRFTGADLVGPLAGRGMPALLREIMRGNAYVNVHTRANPNGEIRGQLSR